MGDLGACILVLGVSDCDSVRSLSCFGIVTGVWDVYFYILRYFKIQHARPLSHRWQFGVGEHHNFLIFEQLLQRGHASIHIFPLFLADVKVKFVKKLEQWDLVSVLAIHRNKKHFGSLLQILVRWSIGTGVSTFKIGLVLDQAPNKTNTCSTQWLILKSIVKSDIGIAYFLGLHLLHFIWIVYYFQLLPLTHFLQVLQFGVLSD